MLFKHIVDLLIYLSSVYSIVWVHLRTLGEMRTMGRAQARAQLSVGRARTPGPSPGASHAWGASCASLSGHIVPRVMPHAHHRKIILPAHHRKIILYAHYRRDHALCASLSHHIRGHASNASPGFMSRAHHRRYHGPCA